MNLSSEKKQKGQAIPIGIASILGVTVLMLALFNTSQVTSEKMRIVNTADAAAYSGMVIQARTLNFKSYTNRAMVANQVAVAQMVTLFSFGEYVERLGENIGTVLKAFPPVAWIGAIIENATKLVNNAIKPFVNATSAAINIIQTALSASQAMANGFVYISTPQVISNVVKANDTNYEVTLLGMGGPAKSLGGWSGMTKQYKNNFYQNRKAQLALRSRDNFASKPRGWGKEKLFDFWFVSAYFQRDADTRLFSKGQKKSKNKSDINWEWKAKDTFSIWGGVRWFSCGWSSCGWKYAEQEVPIGWATAYVSENNKDFDPSSGKSCSGWFCSAKSPWKFKNMLAEKFGDADKIELSAGYDGIQDYYMITDADLKKKASLRPINALGIEIRRKTNSPIRTSSNINNLGSTKAYTKGSTKNGLGAKGLYRVDDQFAGKNYGVSAVARAELYFSRPVGTGKWAGHNNFGSNTRADQKEEYANLFNPYWDVRLVNASSERNAALLARGLSSIF